jgi:type VI secretion system ImpC/EvpB family protein
MSGASVSPTPESSRPESPGSAASSLLDRLVHATRTQRERPTGLLDSFLAETSWARALRLWLGASPVKDRQQLVSVLNRDVALIDHIINEQVNAVLHHPRFQQLEASWRGLDFLTRRADEDGDPAVKIKVLNVSWGELERDFDRAIEFDQSQLFRKVYETEFGTPGGEPFGVLIGDYEIHPRLGRENRHDDLGILESIAGVAAAAFCPFIANVSPAMFGLDEFAGLQHTLDHARTMNQLDYLKWRSLRESDDARFVGLALPRILMRLPYGNDNSRVDGFTFQEDVRGPDSRKYLWGGAAFAMGSVILRAFSDAGWPADVRGVRRGVESGGLVTGLVVHEHGTDSAGVSLTSTTDVVITDQLEKQLSELGFAPLCHCVDTEYAAFYSVPSIQKPKLLDRAAPTANAKISSMMQYMLCVSRFAHYIKAIGRDRVGGFTRSEDFELFLQDWLTQYVVLDDDASPETKARYPLREAKVQVRPKPGSSGAYNCIIHLVPHYELDGLTASVRLTTEIVPPRAG